MQDRYVGDVGDFGKYGLLKALCGDDLSLGVVWYLVPDENHNQDGKYTQYLNPTSSNLRKYKDCDSLLYEVLRGIVGDGARNVRSIRERGVLPSSSTFYEDLLSFVEITDTGQRDTEGRREHRNAWMQGALEVTRNSDIVFADPDNGLEVTSVERYKKLGPKYAYFDELAPYAERGQSLVIYQHRTHTPVDTQVQERLYQLNDKLGEAFALLYPSRIFFVVPSDAHREILIERAQRLARDPCWSQHFTLIEPGQ